MSILVTGGAGYIGSHVVRLLEQRGESVIVVDDFSSGLRSRVSGVVVELDLAAADATSRLVDVMRAHDVSEVVHLAALKDVAESVAEPERYYRVNVAGLGHLLEAMRRVMVDRLVFSSSAAVYGAVQDVVVTERTPCSPINPYGQTKLIGEWMIGAAHDAWGLQAISLRYFNVAGAGWDDLSDTAAKNLIPIVVDRVRRGESTVVFGDDHDTPDGTCIRDYVHVADLARAHLAAVDTLRSDTGFAGPVNIGTGNGASVREVVTQVSNALGRPATLRVGDARAGDPAAVVADPSVAAEHLGWRAQHGLDAIVRSAVSTHSASCS
jgi:UDP-glucose 4-epimerase